MSLLNQPITIFPKRISSSQMRTQGNTLGQTKRLMTYYEAMVSDGSVIAQFHIGQGIQMKGQSEMWRVLKQPNIESLMQPNSGGGSQTASSIFMGSTNLFGKVCRVTTGEDRLGGYVVEGNGWRGSRIRRASDGVRLANLYAEGDPAEIFHLDPARPKPEIPMTAIYIIIYFLLERELRHGSWISRPASRL